MEGGVWPYLIEEPPNYHLGGLSPYTPQQEYQGFSSPNYGPATHHQDFLSPQHHSMLPHSSYEYDQDGVFHNATSPYHNNTAQYPEDAPFDLPYHYREGDWEEEEEVEEEEEEGDLLPANSLEEALQDLNICLPRLAVIAPPSVLPPKGGGRCRLPNLGYSSYMNAVLQCFYHTPSFPASLSRAYEELGERQRQGNTVAHALTSLMTKMDDVKLMKRGVMAYFKGVCGLRDEAFAGMEQQEAHDFLVGLLKWLHQDLAVWEELDCACTKNSLTKRLTTTTASSNNNATTGAPEDSSINYHLQQQQPGNHHTHHSVYTGGNHKYTNQQQEALDDYQHYHQQQYREDQHNIVHDHHHHHHHHKQNNYRKYQEQQHINHNSNSSPRSDPSDTRKKGKVCPKCAVTFQWRSFVSDMFEGIHQLDIICSKAGIILHTTYERFTSLSVPLNALTEVTLEEALQQYYGMSMVMWNCEYCDTSHLCHQQIRVLCSPPILLIHLNRPTKRSNTKKQSVVFPADHLTLEDHKVPARKERSQCHKYNLYAVCNNPGTVGGHYTACCRANKCQTQQGCWFLFDDEKVSRTAHFRNTKEACVLFYASLGVEMMKL